MLDFLFQVPFMLFEFLFNLVVWAGLFYYGYIFAEILIIGIKTETMINFLNHKGKL